ncbi:MAG: hypothetical protein ACD_79C00136G0001, partial [uncultured bacterium]
LKGKLIQDLDSLIKLAKANLFTWEDLFAERNKEIFSYVFDEKKTLSDKEFLLKTSELFTALGLNIDIWHKQVTLKGEKNEITFGQWINKITNKNDLYADNRHIKSDDNPFFKMLDNFKPYFINDCLKYYDNKIEKFLDMHLQIKGTISPSHYINGAILSKAIDLKFSDLERPVDENITNMPHKTYLAWVLDMIQNNGSPELKITYLKILSSLEDFNWKNIWNEKISENTKSSSHIDSNLETIFDWIIENIRRNDNSKLKSAFIDTVAKIKDLHREYLFKEPMTYLYQFLLEELNSTFVEKIAESIVNVMLKSNELTPNRININADDLDRIIKIIEFLEARFPKVAVKLADLFNREKGLKYESLDKAYALTYFKENEENLKGAVKKVFISLISQIEDLTIDEFIKATNVHMGIGSDNPWYEFVIEGLRAQFANGEEPTFSKILDALEEFDELKYDWDPSEGEPRPVIEKIIGDAVERTVHGTKAEYKKFTKLKQTDDEYDEAKEKWEKVTSKDSLVVLLKVLSKCKFFTLKDLKERKFSALHDPMIGDFEYSIYEWIKRFIDFANKDVSLKDAPPNIRIFIMDLLNKFDGVSVKEFDKDDYEILDAVWTWTLNDENSEVKLAGLQWFINLKDMDLEFFTKEEIHILLEKLIDECKDEKVLKKCYELYSKVLKESGKLRSDKLDNKIQSLENELVENDSQIEAISKAINKIIQKITENEKLEDSIRSMKLKSEDITPKHVALLFKEDIKNLDLSDIDNLIFAAGLYFTWDDLITNADICNAIFDPEKIIRDVEYRKKFADLLVGLGLNMDMLFTVLPVQDNPTLLYWLQVILGGIPINDDPNTEPLFDLFRKVKPEKLEDFVSKWNPDYTGDKAYYILNNFFSPNVPFVLYDKIIKLNLLTTISDMSLEVLDKTEFIYTKENKIYSFLNYMLMNYATSNDKEKILYLNLLTSLKDFNWEEIVNLKIARQDLPSAGSPSNFFTLLVDIPVNASPELRIAIYKTIGSLNNLSFEDLLDIQPFNNLTNCLGWIKTRIELDITNNNLDAALEASKIVESIV